jgi:hypothetical protein
VKREFLNKHGDASGKWGNCMIAHSVCVVGYCCVQSCSYYILKDTQDLEECGHPGTSCSLVPENELDIGEMYTIEAVTNGLPNLKKARVFPPCK